MMDQDQKKELKKTIEGKIQDLQKNIKGLQKIVSPIGPDRAFGKVGRIDAMQYQEIQKAGLEAAQANLHQLEHALHKIDDPSFGTCARCGGGIGFERLEALPETRQCIACSEKGF